SGGRPEPGLPEGCGVLADEEEEESVTSGQAPTRVKVFPDQTGSSSVTSAPTNCEVYRSLYAPSAAISSSWLPCSTIAPASITRMVSASRIVDRRWAMTNAVRPS